VKSKKLINQAKTNQAKAIKLFARHSCNTLYFTTDGTAFTQKAQAKAHASWLTAKTIETIKREE
jgi:hypothetical protein